MISTQRLTKKYCKDPLSCIENYELAVNDQVNRWDLHHKDEIDLQKSRKELIEMGLYWNCPAERLIFLPHNEHRSLHAKLRNGMYGRQHTKEARKKMSDALKGRRHTEEHRKKISEAHKGKLGRAIEVVYNGITTKYKTITEAANKLNISVGTIQNIIKGKHKPRKNLIIRYL